MLHTPPCGSSQSKSTRFSLLTSLLLFFLLMVGSNAAWATAYTGNLYIVGTCTDAGWDPNSAFKLDRDGSIYTWEGHLKTGSGTDGFKFLTARNWDDFFGPSNGTEDMSDGAKGYLLDPKTSSNQSMATTNLLISKKSYNNTDRKWRVTTNAGYYKITVDLSDDANGKMTIEQLDIDNVPDNCPNSLWIAGKGLNVNWDPNDFVAMTKSSFGIFWKKAKFRKSWDDNTFKFMPQQAWGWQWGPQTDGTTVDVDINTSSSYTGYTLAYVNGDSSDKKFHTVTNSGDRNVVCDFVSESSPKMYIYPSDNIYLDMGGTRYAMAWNESTGNYTCSTTIPASSTFRFCVKSDGSGTLGAASSNLEMNTQGQETKIVRNGNNYFTTPSDKQINSLTLHLATRKLTLTDVEDAEATPEPEPEPAERTISTAYRLRGDLWAYDNSGNWAGKDNSPDMTLKCYSELDGTYTFSYIAPVADKNRFTVMIGGGADKTASLADGSTSGVTVDGVKYKFNVTSSPKQVDIVFNPSTDKAQVVLSDYTPNTEGWYFKCESAIGGIAADTKTALNSSGILTLSSVSAGTYYFYICNNDAELYWGQNKFGGCYVDQTNSTASLISSKTADAKFDGKEWPIMEVKDRKVKMVVSAGDAGKDVRISFDGGKIVLTAIAPVAPHTVTIHPNNGESTFTMNVADGGTISSIAASYGNGTASWYKDAELTQAFTLNSSTVTEDMDLYAKWGVSGNFYLVGDFGMHDKGSNWAYNSGLAMTTTDGVASVTYIAPKGRHRFEILTSRSSWPAIANQGSGLIAASTPTLSWSNEGAGGYYHFKFDLDAPKKVTVRYDGKVSVSAEDYVVTKTGWTVASKSLFGHGSEESPDNADDGAYMNGYNMTEGQMNSDGELVIHNLNAGTYKFWIGKYNTALNKQKQNVEVFGAAHVDKSNSSLGEYGSLANVSDDTYNRSIPMDDKLHRRVQFSLNQRASIKIAFDGGKITVNLLPKYTVTFNSNGGSEVASQSVFEGATASEPSAPTKAGCTFVKWQLSGADYDFSSAVNGNITLDAVWANKPIESVALNESSHTTWVGNSDFVLTLTKNPSDLITKSIVWSSDDTGVASVDGGTVHAAGVGTATITCTVTDMFDNVRSATCEVTVAACEMTTDDLYSMTVTGYNSSTGSSATLNGLWNESSDNDGPAELKAYYLPFSNNSTDGSIFAYDDNGVVKVKSDKTENTSTLWYFIKAGNETFTPSFDNLDGHSVNTPVDVYYVKNKSTNRYLHRGSSEELSGDWKFAQTLTSSSIDNNNINNYKWVIIQPHSGAFYMIPLNMSKKSDGNNIYNAFHLHTCNQYNEGSFEPANYKKPYLICGRQSDNNRCHGIYNFNLNNPDVTEPNPAYIQSQMNSSYYRMKENATVQANLANGLAYGSIITVRLYADAVTSVKLQTAAGDDVETINLNADAAREFTYTVAYGSALVGETAFVIKAADNHAGIASIEVTRMHAVSPADPALTWESDLSGGVEQSALAGTFQHVASSALSAGAIHYVSSDPSVATVAANGTVTPIMAGSTTITATIEQRECYAEASINYNVTLTEPTLAEMIAADAGEGITLTHDYNENIVIDKEITINGNGHEIGNLTVKNEGDLTLSGALTVNDFSIYAKAGNTTIPAASGQVRNATNLTANGNAYFYYTVDPSGTVHFGWYDFTVPFPVDVMTGIAGIQDAVLNEDFVNERNYAILEHLGDKQAEGQYAYKKFRGVMQPCRLYSITLDDEYNYNTIRFKKADGALVAGNEVALNSYPAAEAKHANWNGVGNGTLHHADVEVSTVGYIQVYQSGDKTFLPVDRGQYSLVVGSAFMVQQAGTMTLNQATHDALLAPRREASAQPIAVQIAREGKPFSDQLFISADELAGQAYTQGVDVAKAGNLGSAKVAQIWVNAYDSKLCAHEAQLNHGRAKYALSLYAPADGSYTLTGVNVPDDCTLYLTKNGKVIWNLGYTCDLDMTKGTTTEYGLLLVESPQMSTGVENIGGPTNETTKIMRNGILYILHDGKVFNAQGAIVR